MSISSTFKKNKSTFLNIRQENVNDYAIVHDLIEKAFRNEEVSDHTEQFLVKRLRTSEAFIPELSLVAEKDDQIIGHILFTKILINDGRNKYDSLALAPVSVLPEYQGQGVGSALIDEGHNIANVQSYKSVILLGHSNYYPRFGYEKTSKYNISLPFEAPEEICMVKSLVDNGLDGISGEVIYPKEFFE